MVPRTKGRYQIPMVTLPLDKSEIDGTFPVTEMTERLNQNQPYSYIKYGDSEWRAIFGYKGKAFICPDHDYDPEQGKLLNRTVMQKHYGDNLFYGFPRHCIKEFRKENLEWKHGPTINWVDANALYWAAGELGTLNGFVKALRKKQVCLVGPRYLVREKLNFIVSAGCVTIPERNAFKERARIAADILKMVETTEVFVFSAGLTTNILIYFLYPLLGHSHFLLDCGSIWDPHVGNMNRNYYKKPEFKEWVERNLAE